MDLIEEKIKKILQENLDKDKYSYFLFGSRAKGDFNKKSDYDVGVIGTEKLDLRKYVQLKRLLDDNINYKVDLVDFNRVGDNFKKIALKNIKIWNKSKNTCLLK